MTAAASLEDGVVVFRVDGRRQCCAVRRVREVVRGSVLVQVPAAGAPLAGLLDVRGRALPVYDVGATAGERPDVLVLGAVRRRGRVLPAVGLRVERVVGVLDGATLPPLRASADLDPALPGHVEGVLELPDGELLPVVDPRALVAQLTGRPSDVALEDGALGEA